MSTTDNQLWEFQFEEVVRWLAKRGYSVVLKSGVDDQIVFDDKTILIDSHDWPETRFYTLLHEAGHYLLNEIKDSFLEDHPVYPSEVFDKRTERSRKYLVSMVSEELAAWNKGSRLAKRLDLYINKKKFFDQMTDAVFSYIEVAAAVGTKKIREKEINKHDIKKGTTAED